MNRIIIIGAGPAGLTAAYEILKKSKDFEVIILEETKRIGGISRTVNYKGNRMDIGGHRFFSKANEVEDWWDGILPMMERERLSRIFFNQKFFDYPISLKFETIKNMGFLTTLKVGCSYMGSAIHKRPEKSLEDFYINRFGEKLYSMFFENYTENLWGRHPSGISPEWGAQRVKGLSIKAVLKDIFGKTFKIKNREVETSLIEKFRYPKLGPGQMWETVAKKVQESGGKIVLGAKVVELRRNAKNQITSVVYEKDGKKCSLRGSYVISSMPVKDLVVGLESVPKKYTKIAEGLPYRDYMTIGVLVPNLTKKVKDNWIYVHDRNVKMGRIQVYNNWSPYLVKDKNKIWLGLEYFCNEGDELWSLSDKEFCKMAVDELVKIGLLDDAGKLVDYHVEREKKAYPAYFDTYAEFDELRRYLDKIPNLFLVGRNGQHRYNNMDHSMLTAFEAVKNILAEDSNKANIWEVNSPK